MKISGQFARYAVIGAVSNGLLYFAYLMLTWFGLDPKFSMSLLYFLGVFQTYFFNKKWIFRHNGAISLAFIRYSAVYIFGYFLNFSALLLFADYLYFPHQIVQGIIIVVLACLLFMAQKYWVFRPQAPILSSGPGEYRTQK
jgi:putative flippase GtrA